MEDTQTAFDNLLKKIAAEEHGLGGVFDDVQKVLGFIETLRGEEGKTPQKGVDYLTEEELSAMREEVTPRKGVHYKDGDPGEPGYTPQKGVDYFTEEEVAQMLEQVTPKKGTHYFTDAEIRDVIKKATPKKGKDYFTAEDVNGLKEQLQDKNPLTAQGVAEMLLSLPEKEAAEFWKKVASNIDISTIRNAQSFMFNNKRYNTSELMHGAGDTVAAGTNITITEVNGVKVISATGGSSAGASNVLMFTIPTGTVNGTNVDFTVTGQVVIAGADSGDDSGASFTYDSDTGISSITYSVPPQNNVFAFVISSTNPVMETPTGAVNGVNVTYTVDGRVTTVFTDTVVDVDAVFSYDCSTNVTTITTSVPPQNDISALIVPGFAITTQTPTCTTNGTGLPDGTATIFSAVGQVNAAVGDSGIDTDAILAYQYTTNVTLITYSVPPQNNVSTF